jgi:hypothetical protein
VHGTVSGPSGKVRQSLTFAPLSFASATLGGDRADMVARRNIALSRNSDPDIDGSYDAEAFGRRAPRSMETTVTRA